MDVKVGDWVAYRDPWGAIQWATVTKVEPQGAQTNAGFLYSNFILEVRPKESHG